MTIHFSFFQKFITVYIIMRTGRYILHWSVIITVLELGSTTLAPLYALHLIRRSSFYFIHAVCLVFSIGENVYIHEQEDEKEWNTFFFFFFVSSSAGRNRFTTDTFRSLQIIYCLRFYYIGAILTPPSPLSREPWAFYNNTMYYRVTFFSCLEKNSP